MVKFRTILTLSIIVVGTIYHLNKNHVSFEMKLTIPEASHIQLGIYRHYKNKNYYKVIGTGNHTETHEAMVYYQALYGDYGYWIRPMKMFTENIKINDQYIPRFVFVSPN